MRALHLGDGYQDSLGRLVVDGERRRQRQGSHFQSDDFMILY